MAARQVTEGDADLATIAKLLAEPSRAAMLIALTDGRALPAGELARVAGVQASTASAHLTRMHAAGLLAVERHGRHRYYRLACPHLGTLTELLAQLAPRRPVRSLRGARAASGLSLARTCYDHLAGDIGVAVCESLQTLRVITISDGRVGLGHRHDDLLTKQLGVDLHAFRGDRRRPDARLCLDWTARRHHLAGALGAALTHRLVELGWLHRHPSTRALAITSNGWAGFETYFGITKEQLAEDVIRLPA